MYMWIKVASVGVPMILAGTVYAFASTTSHSATSPHGSLTNAASNASARTSSGNVIVTLGKPEFLPNRDNGYSQTQPSSPRQGLRNNESPVLVSNHTVTRTKTPHPITTNATSPIRNAFNTIHSEIASLTMEQIQHLHFQSDPSQGNLDVDYHSDPNGNVHLEGHVGSTHIHLTGGNATQAITRLISKWDVLNILQQILDNPTESIRIPFQHLEIQTTDGTHIDLQENGQLHVDVHPHH